MRGCEKVQPNGNVIVCDKDGVFYDDDNDDEED